MKETLQTLRSKYKFSRIKDAAGTTLRLIRRTDKWAL